ncbi:MAG: hypothetical protein U0Y08_01940 [Bacteroidia bacterium]
MFYKTSHAETDLKSVFRSVQDIRDIDFGDTGVFLDPAYLSTLEEAAPEGMDFRYVVINNDVQSFLYYFQTINLSSLEIGQIINKQPFSGIVKAVCDLIQGILFGTKKDKPNYLLVCGNMCLSGPYGIAANTTVEAAHHLFEAIERCTKDLNKQGKVIGTIIKDFPEQDDPFSPVIKHHRYNRLVMDPVMKMKIRPNWNTMDDYLGDLSAKYRQRFQQARKKLGGIEIKDMTVKEMLSYHDRINELYTAVQLKSPVRLVKPDAGYLIGLKKNLGTKMRFRGLFDGDNMIGFLTGISDGFSYEAHHIGIDYHYNKTHAVYLNILYFYIEMAIDAGAGLLSFGRTALEMKTTVGAVPEPHSAWIKLNNGMLNSLIRYMLPDKAEEDWIPRNPFKA